MCDNIMYHTDVSYLDPSANLTNGVTATVITAPDEELRGIRVMWRIKTEYLGCHFTTLRVELYNASSPEAEVGKNISVSNTTADFVNEQLKCNAPYTPRVRAVYHDSVRIMTTFEDNGIPVLYRGNIFNSYTTLQNSFNFLIKIIMLVIEFIFLR